MNGHQVPVALETKLNGDKTMESTATGKKNIDPALISAAAYQFWEKAGRPPGRDMEFWLEAEAQLRATAPSDSQPPSKAATPSETKEKQKSSDGRREERDEPQPLPAGTAAREAVKGHSAAKWTAPAPARQRAA